jgi:hypothetical protein
VKDPPRDDVKPGKYSVGYSIMRYDLSDDKLGVKETPVASNGVATFTVSSFPREEGKPSWARKASATFEMDPFEIARIKLACAHVATQSAVNEIDAVMPLTANAREKTTIAIDKAIEKSVAEDAVADDWCAKDVSKNPDVYNNLM